MNPTHRIIAIVIAAGLTAPVSFAGPAYAFDPNSTAVPQRQPDPGPAPLPDPGRQTGPTVGFDRVSPPQVHGGLAADQDAEVDRIVAILLGATDLAAPGGACPGMITCCNSAWVQGCNADYFQDVCEIYDGVYQTQVLSDGSINYECHYAD